MSDGEADRVRGGLRSQFEALAAKRSAGAELIGWKIGLNVPAVQRRLGITKPALGHLTTESLIEDGSTHPIAGGVRVGIEPEVAIHLGESGSISALGPAIEVVDLDPAITELESILAENVFHRGVVLGAPVEGVGTSDLAALTVTVVKSGSVAEQARFAEAGGEPAEMVRVIAERLALVGEELRRGQVIIAGSLTPVVFVEPGDTIEVDLGPLGGLALSLA